jgi:murein DD-endopeptidase MepM/ murein hydrolase activator NlpD
MQQRRRRGGPVVMAAAVVAAGFITVAAPAVAEAATAAGIVYTGGTPLNVRAAPASSATRTGTLQHGARISIVCLAAGTNVAGAVRTTTLWDKLSTGGYVSDGYVRRPSSVPPCPAAKPAGTTGVSESWIMPVSAPVGSGFRTAHRPTHNGIDLSVPRNTPIKAASDGRVIRVTCNTNNNNCNVDGYIGAGGCGWYVEVQHAGNVVTRYCHMVRQPAVTVGQTVRSGQLLGYVGTSGNSSGPHLHFEVHRDAAPALSTNATDPVPFLRTKGLNIH